MHIPEVPAHVSFPEEERKVLEFWDKIDAFHTSLRLSEGRKPFSFFDGPPFATGLPHHGHVLTGTVKDVVTRYAHMTGHHVERRFGWDCHGLPVEHEIDKMLGIKSVDDVMKMGIKAYNAECRAIVMKYSAEWEDFVRRIGRWIDFKNDYKTLDTTFMESVWWVFKQLYDKDQVYKGFMIMPYSTGCTTPMSNFEANLNYKDTIDPSVVVSFPLVSDPSVSLLAWTTTPWTLPCNLALCVNPAFEYVKIKDGETGNVWILLESRLDMIYKDPKKAEYAILEKVPGTALKGLKYVPLFDYFLHRKDCFVVVADSYVTNDSGTGIVHQAPAFGEDDFRVCLAHGVVSGQDVPCPLDPSGNFTAEVRDYQGQYIKDAEKQIQKDLKAKGRLLRQSQFSHSYPFCWRSDTPLIYRAVPSWFVRVANIREKLLKCNAETNWVPDFAKEKRFANWLDNARDWNISRNRYWGTPLPLWISEDGEEIVVVGSVAELEELTGEKGITDLHRESIDHLTMPSRKGKGVLRRTPEVLDCWFESGCMPIAQQHFPFENADKFKTAFPADFIAEGLDQTRGWFYTLLVISAHLFGTAPWKNLITTGLVLAIDGKKVSKSKKNFLNPSHILESYGADAFRLYLINSPLVRAEPLRFQENGLKALVASVFLPWFNSYRFFFAQLSLLKKEHDFDFVCSPEDTWVPENVMDKWILASTQSLIMFTRDEMAAYRLHAVVPRLLQLVDTLTNWYIRFNRKRLKGDTSLGDAANAVRTLFQVLFTLCKMMAPFTPFLTETMYQNLRTCLPPSATSAEDTRSVHFLPYPIVNPALLDADVERSVRTLQDVIELGRSVRDRTNKPLKTPLRELVFVHPEPAARRAAEELRPYILEELNVKRVMIVADEAAAAARGVRYELRPDHRALGRRLGAASAGVRAALGEMTAAQVSEYVETGRVTLGGVELVQGDFEVVRVFDAAAAAGGVGGGAASAQYEAKSLGACLVMLDVTDDPGLVQEGFARELVNRVQRLRKKAGLQPTDDVLCYYEVLVDEKGLFAKTLQTQDEHLKRALKGFVANVRDRKAGAVVIADETQEVDDINFRLVLVKA
ncbi:tRNA synthetases class I-domain-containing protein [Zopfochytrium polystomum]|nr:tRNA synthetases class I-domain-containing protein [Zopfochytrium polystomum]